MVPEIFAFSCMDTARPDFEKTTFISNYCLFQIPAGENGHNFALKNAIFFQKMFELQTKISS